MRSRALVLSLLAAVLAPALALAQAMPDPRQMSGMPLPVGDVPVGTVTVRVIRGQLTNAIPKQTVELNGPGVAKTATTDDAGRAQFDGLTPGARVKASTTVAGERIESREFDVPATGGIRMMLVATDPETEKRAAEDRKLAQEPPIPGTVVLGDQSRFVIELGDDGVNVFNILQILNTARRAVQSDPLVFDLPPDAAGASVIEGSSPSAVAGGRRVIVSGPFAPGTTPVQFAYTLPYGRDTMTIEQRIPAAMPEVTILAQRTPSMRLTSPQIKQMRDMNEEGESYILGQGPALRAGDVVSFTFTGLPHRAVWPRNLAVAAAVTILAFGGWMAVRGRTGALAPEARRKRLQARRDALFAELTAVEQRRRRGAIDEPEYDERRRDLVASLESVYAALDDEAAA